MNYYFLNTTKNTNTNLASKKTLMIKRDQKVQAKHGTWVFDIPTKGYFIKEGRLSVFTSCIRMLDPFLPCVSDDKKVVFNHTHKTVKVGDILLPPLYSASTHAIGNGRVGGAVKIWKNEE